jgi:hypothetical protein
MRRNALALALVVLTLGIQTLAAAHAPGVHEEHVPTCAEGTTHFCADETASDAGPCLLCQLSAGGIVCDEGETVVAVLETGPSIVPSANAVFASPRHSPESPRAPPVG